MNCNKLCIGCKEYLPMDTKHFHKKSSSKDGFDYRCKKCKGSSYGKHHRDKVELTCKNCKGKFTKAYWERHSIYCGRECHNEWVRNNDNPKRSGKYVKCKVCEVEFYKRPSDIAKCCSKECGYKLITINRIKKYEKLNNIKDMKVYLEKQYVYKNASFREIMKDLNIKNNRFVKRMLDFYNIEIRQGSDAVKTQWMNNKERREQQGETFKQSSLGNTRRRLPVPEIINRFEEYGLEVYKRVIVDRRSVLKYICEECGYDGEKELGNKNGCPKCAIKRRTIADQSTVKAQRSKTKPWRKEVLERDKYTCQSCGNKDDLRGHHIESFASNKHLRLDINNGITLCKYCHDCGYDGSFHEVYGVYNNNREQLNEYIYQRRALL